MKEQWNHFSDAFAKFYELLLEFEQKVPSRQVQKATKVLTDYFSELIDLHNEYDRLVEPVPKLEIKLPFESDAFASQWQMYKEYLEESHGSFVVSRREIMMLRRLHKLANGDEKKAMDMLEFFMSHGHKSIYQPKEKLLYGKN